MTELVKVTLAQDWNNYKANSTIKVDSDRAAALKHYGYLSEKKVKKSARVPESEK